MKIGIVSDTHGQAERLQQAVDVFHRHGAQAIVHCGDVGGCPCLDVLASAALPVYVVAGNTDHDMLEMQAYAHAHGIQFDIDLVMVPLNGHGKGPQSPHEAMPIPYLAATHGNQPWVLQKLLARPDVSFLCHGHTHRQRDEQIGHTRVINPGALDRSLVHSVALVDTDANRVEFLNVD